MPSSNVRDDLPSHYDRVAELRRVAAAVIQRMGRIRPSGITPRIKHTAAERGRSEQAKAKATAEPQQIEGALGTTTAEFWQSGAAARERDARPLSKDL